MSAIYRQGAAVSQSYGDPDGANTNLTSQNFNDKSEFEVTNNYVNDINDKVSLQWALVYNQAKRGMTIDDSKGDTITWTSTGVRPIYYLSQHVNVALELGYDHVDDEFNNFSGDLRKATVALQLSKDRGYYSRPTIRAFVTYASWSDELVGKVASDSAYADKNNGWNAGVQAEVWW